MLRVGLWSTDISLKDGYYLEIVDRVASLKLVSLFSGAEIVPLLGKDGAHVSFSDAVLSVSEGGFVVTEKAAGVIRFFDRNGYESSQKVVSASIQDVYASCGDLVVLVGTDVMRLTLPELDIITETHLPDSLKYEKIGKRLDDSFTHSDVVVISAYSAHGSYFCELYLNDNSFHPCLSPFTFSQEEIASVMSCSHFFTSASSGDLLFQYSDSGDIWRCASFMSPKFKWTLVNTDCLGSGIVFENAQVTSNYIFLTVRSDISAHTFIIDRKDNEVSVLKTDEDYPHTVWIIDSDCAYSLAESELLSSGAAVLISSLKAL